MRKTRILCTLGPATDNDDTMRAMISAGMDVARFNFSHGTHEEQKERLERLVRIRREMDVPIATMLDTGGPEIRLRKFKDGKIEMTAGENFTLTTRDVIGDESLVSVSYSGLPRDVKPDATILLDDGHVELTVLAIDNTDILCRVENSGEMSDRKGVNLPGTRLSMEFISEKDREDLLFGIENGFDTIAASFTRSADDIREIKELLSEYGGSDIKIIAKIENRDGVQNIDEILDAADGIMVARGDMGVELPMEEIPGIQKLLIKKAIVAGKPVITATQMLDSMIKNPRPTRAEVTDVANAIYDCTSAIMLSGETAAGKYPVEAVRTMSRIAEATERDINYEGRFRNNHEHTLDDITTAISHAGCMSAYDLGAAAIVAVTCSGRTARMISKYRPGCPCIACTPDPRVCRQMQFYWGVYPILIPMAQHNDSLIASAVRAARETGLLKSGDIAVLTAGVPIGRSGSTNLLRIVEI